MGAATVTLDPSRLTPRDVKRLTRRAPVDPLGIREHARQFREIAGIVRKHWHGMPEEMKTALRLTAYELLDQQVWPSAWKYRIRTLAFRLQLVVLLVRTDTSLIREYLEAVDAYIEAVTDAIEREDERYRTELSSAIQTTVEAPPERMTVDQFRERFSSI